MLLLPVISNAQIEAGANYGIAPYSATFNNADVANTKMGSKLDVSVSYSVYNIVLGCGYSSSNLPSSAGNQNTYFAKPLTDKYLLAGYNLNINKLTISPFLMYGISNTSGGDFYAYNRSGNGNIWGLRGSVSYRLWKGLCANIQIDYTSVSLKTHGNIGVSTPELKESASLYSISIGVHYKLNLFKKGK